MIRDINHDVKILSKKVHLLQKDLAILQPIIVICVGMAANMIGKNKCIMPIRHNC